MFRSSSAVASVYCCGLAHLTPARTTIRWAAACHVMSLHRPQQFYLHSHQPSTISHSFLSESRLKTHLFTVPQSCPVLRIFLFQDCLLRTYRTGLAAYWSVVLELSLYFLVTCDRLSWIPQLLAHVTLSYRIVIVYLFVRKIGLSQNVAVVFR